MPNHLIKAHEIHSEMLKKGWAQQTPNTETVNHSTDQAEKFEFGGKSKHWLSQHVTQTYDWDKHPFTYKWNSLGLRGPEPDYNANQKILTIGNSLTLGQGVPVENSCIHLLAEELQADYINLSEFFVLTDCIDQLLELAPKYNPDVVLIWTGRFITGLDMITNYGLKKIPDFKDPDARSRVNSAMFNTSANVVRMFEALVKETCPNAKAYWVTPEADANSRPRDSWLNEEVWSKSDFDVIKINLFDSVVDLGRDNQHPGIESHKRLRDLICKHIK